MSTAANAHEFWIDPESHAVAENSQIVAHLRVGELYEGASYSFLPPRFQRFDFAFDGEVAPVPGTIGDRPALTMNAPGDGLVTLVHATTASEITMVLKSESTRIPKLPLVKVLWRTSR